MTKFSRESPLQRGMSEGTRSKTGHTPAARDNATAWRYYYSECSVATMENDLIRRLPGVQTEEREAREGEEEMPLSLRTRWSNATHSEYWRKLALMCPPPEYTKLVGPGRDDIKFYMSPSEQERQRAALRKHAMHEHRKRGRAAGGKAEVKEEDPPSSSGDDEEKVPRGPTQDKSSNGARKSNYLEPCRIEVTQIWLQDFLLAIVGDYLWEMGAIIHSNINDYNIANHDPLKKNIQNKKKPQRRLWTPLRLFKDMLLPLFAAIKEPMFTRNGRHCWRTKRAAQLHALLQPRQLVKEWANEVRTPFVAHARVRAC